MGRHKEWRKLAKKLRRKKLRVVAAKQRDEPYCTNSEEFKKWQEEQDANERFEIEQIEKQNFAENNKWLLAEKQAICKWEELQEKLKLAYKLKLENEARIRQEWEEEQKRVKEAKERLKLLQEEKEREQKVFLDKLEQFLSGDSNEPPKELMTSKETKPNAEFCPFFSKTGCCRFSDQCSRNHCFPGISKTLLALNFYTHFGLDNSYFNEYDTDVMLEYEDNDTYIHFKEFFNDVLPEFKKFGKIVQFKVCNNYEKHLRGNTYIEYYELRSAVAAYRAMHSRWYGGRQICLQFCTINSWKNAICGLQSNKRCPKGRSCNFLHVFKNPDNLFNSLKDYDNSYRRSRPISPERSWRWSESPEVESVEKRLRSDDRKRRSRSRESKRYSKSWSRRSSRRSSSKSRSPKRRSSSKSRSPKRTSSKSRSPKRRSSTSSKRKKSPKKSTNSDIKK